ncbi:hypothetical protein GGF42_002409 [Coemansia sp. RSA 2424]|nr:hypothetical protein GGF42_002409 [Coemansia sp. RSA 2424]
MYPSAPVASTTADHTHAADSVAQHKSPSAPPPDKQEKVYGRLKVRAPDVKDFRAEPPTLLVKQAPTGEAPKRLLFIGDIHGSVKELNKLLCKLKFKKGEDQVVLVGDLVAKGPESVSVVRRARQIGAWCVRGNHDDRVIRWREFLDGPGKTLSQSELKDLEKSKGLPYDDFKLGKGHYEIARDLSPDDATWMKSLPIIMSLPPPFTEWVVVHGGLDPSKPLLEQDPDAVIETRNIASGGPTSSRDEGTAWFELWAEKMKGLKPDNNTAAADIDFGKVRYNKIIYGHDAGRNLQLHPLTKGLDSRCVYGGQLTAFILPGEKTVSVPCPNYDGGDSDSKRRRRRLRDADAKQLYTHEEQQ